MINSIDSVVFGDSIGLGIAQAAGLPCNCKVGRQPHEIEAAIRATHPVTLAGRNAILSTGMSNNPDGKSHVEGQLRALLEPLSCVARVIIVGVGPGVREGTNEWLADLAQRSGPNAIFAGPLTNTRFDAEPKGVHPWSYEQVVDQINAAI